MADKTVQIAIRIPESWTVRADQLAEQLTVSPEFQVTRTAVYRAALGRGLEALEAEHGTPPADEGGTKGGKSAGKPKHK